MQFFEIKVVNIQNLECLKWTSLMISYQDDHLKNLEKTVLFDKNIIIYKKSLMKQKNKNI